MNRLLSLLLTLAIAGNAYLAWELNSRTPPTNAEIDADLAALRAKRAALNTPDSAALKALVDPVYAQTEATLEQRRLALLRFISLSYSVQGQANDPASPQELDKIDSDIREQQSRIGEAQADIAKYSGGLIQSLMQVRLATAELILAMLQQHRLLLKYGLALPASNIARSTPDASALTAIELEVSEKRKAVADAQRDASRYSGGLILATLLARIEAEKVTIAMLEYRLLSLKYNVGLPTLNVDAIKVPEPRKPPGKVVGDKEAIQ